MSRFPSWHFREMDPGEVHVDPVHDEFFKMQDLADALVREAIQNSLDARRGRGTVRVRFRFATGREALHADAVRHYFHGLRDHIEAVSATIHSAIPRDDEAVPYLLVEDFGTRGLTGDPATDPELTDDPDAKNDFFYFWRNVGRSSKGEIDRGRWGLGKAVFWVASRIRTIFALTVRADDRRALLLGQSVLKTHVIDGTRIYPYGFFARYERRSGPPLPIEEPMLLERFADDFRLGRVEPGLSVVIPYFREDELSLDRLVESSVRQYFYPIIRGELAVEVEGAGTRESIDSRSIDRLVARIGGDSIQNLSRLCALARWSLEDAESNRCEIRLVPERAPRWTDDLIGEDALADIRDRFERGERIAIRVPLLVKRKRARAASSHFDVVLERDESLRKSEIHFIRRGITIPDVKSGGGDKPVRAIVVIDHDALSTFLGDAENPAHSDWSERADKLRTTYDHHAATLRFVKNSATFLASLLSRPPEGRVRDFLQEIFSVEIPEAEPSPVAAVRVPVRTGEGESESPGGLKGSKPAQAEVAIAPIAGGFTIRGTDGERPHRPFLAEIAYRARTGNAFRRHSRFDFDLLSSEMQIESSGATVDPVSPNGIAVMPAAARFQVTIKGFDPRRDLVVRVSERNVDASETELH